MQNTISNPVSCYGIGVHSGKTIQLTLKPAKANTGIMFMRTDVSGDKALVAASYLNIFETSMSSNLKNEYNVGVATIEHLMAALWGCGIDNVLIEIDGPEVPIMDGSSKAFVFMLHCAGIKSQNAPKKYLKILKDIDFDCGEAKIHAEPADLLNINVTIDFDNKIIGNQSLSFNDPKNFVTDIADARTFGFVHELDYLKNKGLAQGASLDNSIGIENDKILNLEGLRYKDEFVRHKVLDQLGDLYACGGRILGSLNTYKAGHTINNQFLRKLLSDPTAYRWVS